MTTTDTTVSNLIINTMTQAQYNQITPSDTELYLVTDSTITSSEVTTALGYTPSNVDLSNINQTAKNTVINTIMPDYANGISYTYTTALTEQSYTMPSDGYFSYTLFSLLSNKAVCYIKINDNAVVEVLAAGKNTSNYVPNSGAGLIPVNKNDVVKVLANYASGDVTKFGFFPMKGAA